MKYDAIFRIYSMTRPLTSITLMQLVEEGRVQVTDPVEKYLPELGKMKVGTEVMVEGKPTLHLDTRFLIRQFRTMVQAALVD